LGYARGGDNTTRRISVGYDLDFVVNIEFNRIKAERDTETLMESVVWAKTYVEKNVECALPTDMPNISDLESILSVAGRKSVLRGMRYTNAGQLAVFEGQV
jgi:hypothetical protein